MMKCAGLRIKAAISGTGLRLLGRQNLYPLSLGPSYNQIDHSWSCLAFHGFDCVSKYLPSLYNNNTVVSSHTIVYRVWVGVWVGVSSHYTRCFNQLITLVIIALGFDN